MREMLKVQKTQTAGKFEVIDTTDGAVIGSIERVESRVATKRQGNVALAWKNQVSFHIGIRRAKFVDAPLSIVMGTMGSRTRAEALAEIERRVQGLVRRAG